MMVSTSSQTSSPSRIEIVGVAANRVIGTVREVIVRRAGRQIDERRGRASRFGVHVGIDRRKIFGIEFRLADAAAKREQIAEILVHAFVHPKQIRALRHLIVRGRKIGGAPILTVPRMRELVRDEIPAGQRLLRIGEKIVVGAVVARLMVFDALETDRDR